jgi:hypothetical protein
MTDRELLEAAAKAAGIVGEYDDIAGEAGIIVMRGLGSRVWTGKVWNPLTDDGDALRLAVRLRLNLSLDRWESRADENEVVRRAIVRAAAAIGRSMK